MEHDDLLNFQVILPSHINNRLIELGFYNVVSRTLPSTDCIDDLINLYLFLKNDLEVSQVILDCIVDGYIYLKKLNYNFYMQAIDEIHTKILKVDKNFVNNKYCVIDDIFRWLETYIYLIENYPQYKKSLVYCGACSLYYKIY